MGGLVECVGTCGGQLGYAVVVGLVGHVVSGLLVVVEVIGCTPPGNDPDTGGCYTKIKVNEKSNSMNLFTVGAA